MKPIFWASLVIVLEKSEGTGKFDKWTVKGRKMTVTHQNKEKFRKA